MVINWVDGDVHLHPAGRLDADVTLPGSKSLTNRYLACCALADGTSTLINASPSDDSQVMVQALRSLGITAAHDLAAGRITVRGAGGAPLSTDAQIDVHHAGTAMRFLTAICCLGYGDFRIDGSLRIRQRPIGELVDALRRLGAKIQYAGEEGYPPIDIHAEGLHGGEVVLGRAPSSQFLSALLLTAPYAQQDVLIQADELVPSRPYVDMTIATMRSMGVEVLQSDGDRFIIAAPQHYRAGAYAIEPDASGAAYLWATAALTGGRVCVRGLSRNSPQGDVHFVDILEQMGCTILDHGDALEVRGPADRALRAVNCDLNQMPDTVQTLAVLSLFAEGTTEIRNVANLRVKETDRLSALTSELSRLGAKIDVHRDGLTIFPPEQVSPARIRTYNDHRMAMSFALAGLVVPGIVIEDASCVSKSFPGFFELLQSMAVAPQD